MDAAAPSAKPKRQRPLFPPNYVSLRHLQELRLKEKEEERQREEAAAIARAKEANYVSLRHLQELRLKEEEEERQREEAGAIAGAKAAAAAAPQPEITTSSEKSCGSKERPRGGQKFVAVAYRSPLPRGEGMAKKRDGGGYRVKKGPNDDAANPPQGGGVEAENKGKEKVYAGNPGGPAETATASSRGGKPEEKRKRKALRDLGTSSETNDAPGEPAEAASASSQDRVRPEYKRKGKKESGGRITETATISPPGETAEAAETSPPRGVRPENKRKGKTGSCRRTIETAMTSSPGETAAAVDAPPPRGVMLENKGKKKPLVGRRADAAPTSDSLHGKRAVPHPVAEGSSDRRSSCGQGKTGEAKFEGLGEKQPMVEVRVAAERRPNGVRGLAGQRPGGGQGKGAVAQQGMVWLPKVATAAAYKRNM